MFRHFASRQYSNTRKIIALSLSFAVLLFLCRCSSLPPAEGLEAGNKSLSGRIIGISFDDAAPVTVRLDRTRLTEANRAYRIRIEYVERPNTAGDIATVRSEFLNFYFLAYGYIQGGSFLAVSTQLVIDIWEHDPNSELKTCHQWLLIDTDVDDNVDIVEAESFTENRWNVVQEIQQIPVPSNKLPEYSRLYRRCVGYLLQRMGSVSIADLFKNL